MVVHHMLTPHDSKPLCLPLEEFLGAKAIRGTLPNPTGTVPESLDPPRCGGVRGWSHHHQLSDQPHGLGGPAGQPSASSEEQGLGGPRTLTHVYGLIPLVSPFRSL